MLKWWGSKKSTKKEDEARKLLLTEWGIAVILFLAILLTQIAGTVDVTRKTGEWTRIEDLDGKTIGVVKDSLMETESAALWPDATWYYMTDAFLLWN